MNVDHIVATVLVVGGIVLWVGVAVWRWRQDVRRGR